MKLIKRIIVAWGILTVAFTVYAMSGSDFVKILFSDPKRFSKTKETNTVITSPDESFERGRAQELRPDISVPPSPTKQPNDSQNTSMNKQKFEDLISGLEQIASFGDENTPVQANTDIIPVQISRPKNFIQKLKWLPPPPGFMTADTYAYLIYRQGQPVTPTLKTVLDNIHGNLMLDLTPFTLVLKPNKILIMLFNQRTSYMNYTKRPAWSGASSDLQSDSLYVIEEPGFYPLTVHELTHLYFDGYFLPTISPLWLSEGMAVYMQVLASKNKPSWLAESLRQIILDGQLIPFEEMMSVETIENYSKDAAALWYTQAYSVVDYLLNHRSRDEFYRFCNELKETVPVYQALYRAYGMPFNKLSSLQNVWLHDLKKAYQEGKISELETPEPIGSPVDNLASAQAIAQAQQIVLGTTQPQPTRPSSAPAPNTHMPTQAEGLQQPRPILHRPAQQRTKINKLQRVEPNFSGGF